ncbi:MAG: hypothetical protein F6J94_21565 [Moorea sp. SIO1F2]|uniref:hypothetical protein n=1 Tax=Moorena sp. SIO3I6 TaxID=2607831 RepID=UPI0013B8FD3C|nr:hypothetical protein [Moorena sp. SIO3I6]NET84408.1 hypothetical protein [Moorena sp. SIO1F2]
MLIVELASCQFHAYCGTGILPVSCLLWNWHLASFILIFERAGCPLYSYSLLDSATPNFFLFPIP